MTETPASQTPVSLNALMREETNMTAYLRQRNVSLAQHIIDRDEAIALLQGEIERLRADAVLPATEATVLVPEAADGE